MHNIVDSTMIPIPGFEHKDVSFFSVATNAEKELRCDIWESQPTFLISHDDVYNLAHYMNDLANVWIMIGFAFIF